MASPFPLLPVPRGHSQRLYGSSYNAWNISHRGNNTDVMDLTALLGGVEVYLHAILISALDGGEWSASHPVPLYPLGKSPRYSRDRRLGGPQSRSREPFPLQNVNLVSFNLWQTITPSLVIISQARRWIQSGYPGEWPFWLPSSCPWWWTSTTGPASCRHSSAPQLKQFEPPGTSLTAHCSLQQRKIHTTLSCSK